jgi:RNA processing factor Prp31
MKRGLLIFNVIVIISLNLFSCGGNKSSEATATEDQASTSEEASIDCGQLVQDYEKYANDFEVSVRKWKADPSDEIAAAQIEDLSAKIEEVGGKITSNMDCMYEYSDKLTEISTKLEEVGKAFIN